MSSALGERLIALQVEIDSLNSRVDKIEKSRLGDVGDSESVKRVIQDCTDLGLTTFRFKRVPDDYYSRSLEERRCGS